MVSSKRNVPRDRCRARIEVAERERRWAGWQPRLDERNSIEFIPELNEYAHGLMPDDPTHRWLRMVCRFAGPGEPPIPAGAGKPPTGADLLASHRYQVHCAEGHSSAEALRLAACWLIDGRAPDGPFAHRYMHLRDETLAAGRPWPPPGAFDNARLTIERWRVLQAQAASAEVENLLRSMATDCEKTWDERDRTWQKAGTPWPASKPHPDVFEDEQALRWAGFFRRLAIAVEALRKSVQRAEGGVGLAPTLLDGRWRWVWAAGLLVPIEVCLRRLITECRDNHELFRFHLDHGHFVNEPDPCLRECGPGMFAGYHGHCVWCRTAVAGCAWDYPFAETSFRWCGKIDCLVQHNRVVQHRTGDIYFPWEVFRFMRWVSIADLMTGRIDLLPPGAGLESRSARG